MGYIYPVSYTHLRAHETSLHLVCRLLLEKKKLPKTCGKRFYELIKFVLCEKRLEKTANIRKSDYFILKIAKNGHNAKAIAHAKYSVWVKNSNCLKHTKNVQQTH